MRLKAVLKRIRVCLAVACMAIFCACYTVDDAGQEAAQQAFRRGYDAQQRGEHQQGIDAYSEAIQLKPDYAEAYNNRGNAYYWLREYQSAMADYNQAIQLKPNFALPYLGRGLAYDGMQQYQSAIAEFNQAIQLKPDFAEAYDDRGRAYYHLGQYQSAISDYNQGLRLKPDLAEAYDGRGSAYYVLREYQSAIADYNRALQLKPDDAFASTNLRLANAELGNSGSNSATAAAKVDFTPPSMEAPVSKPEPVEVAKPSEPAVTSQRRVALVIGNSNYVHLRPSLPNPANDARLMARTLRDLGFTLVGGGAQIDLDKTPFDGAIQKFGAQAQGADVALFYYAGHGIEANGLNYLIPVGAANNFTDADAYFMVDAQAVLAQMDKKGGARLKVMILDARRSNPFARGGSGGLAAMEAPKGTLILYSTAPGHAAPDGPGADSLFTQALAEKIVEPGEDIQDVFNDVGLAVVKTSGGSQVPWEAKSPIEGKFYLAGGATAP